MKRQLPIVLGFIVGAFAVAEFYIPAKGVHTVQSFLLGIALVLAATAYVLGGINLIQVNIPIIQRRRPDWEFKVVLLASALIMGIAGIRWDSFGDQPTPGTITVDPAPNPAAAAAAGNKALVIVTADRDRFQVSIDGGKATPGGAGGAVVEPGEHTVVVRVPESGYSEYTVTFKAAPGDTVTVHARLRLLWGISGRVYTWLYEHVFSPANATMFALLAFFIASAAFRAFRARNAEAALLLAASILVMVGRVPIGRSLSEVFPQISEWIVEIPNNAGRRAIIIGAALGGIATSLRVILGLERSHLGRD
jgi:hypothetical protein